ncbi:histidinol dehydrogenase, partial [candidate division KSB1 bacterium]|nr:histidinol dehydrogenase [candidate division KSB1 bacterium]
MLPLYHSPEEFLTKNNCSLNSNPELPQQVSGIIEKVRQEGDAALKFFTQKFDEITLETLRVPREAMEAARNTLPLKTKQLFLAAIENVRSYHQKQRPESWLDKPEDGGQLGMRFNPINRVGVYIPGGKAAYPSTVIMTIVPAQIAGVDRLVLVTPPTREGSVNSYVFIKSLSGKLKEGDVIVSDQGGNLTWTIQAWEVKKDQELFSAFGNSPMGYALPAAIGAAFARPEKDIYCIDGDGGFQLNIQELQTVVHHNLSIKMFVLNNHAYGIIKQFQEAYFGGRYEGTIPATGYSMPDFIKVSQAYGIPTETITNHEELPEKLDKILAMKGPVLIDVLLDESQKLIPKLVAVKSEDVQRYISKPIEDM